MKEAYEKIRKRIEDVRMGYFLTIANGGDKRNDAVYEGISKATDHALSIVSEVEAEYEQSDHTDYANIELYAFWKEHQWIPCSERLPEENGRYITTNMYEGEKEEVFDMWYEDGKWFIDAGEDETIRIVLAWMPLPESYRVNHEAELPFSDVEESEVEE